MDIGYGLTATGPGSFYSYKTDIVEPISPIINGHIGRTLSVPIYPKPIYPFINGHIGSTILVL
jgi:hypothetical protein